MAHSGLLILRVTTELTADRGWLKLGGSLVSFPLSTNQQRLNRIIRGQFDDVEVTLHSLRHTFKDLARDAGISEEVHKFITGHGTGDVSGNYGHGPSLKTRYDAIMSIPFPWID